MAFTLVNDAINRGDAMTEKIDWFVFLRQKMQQTGA